MNEFFEALKNKRARKEYIKSILVGLFSTAVDFVLQAVIMYIYSGEQYAGFFNIFTGKTISGVPYSLPLSIFMTSIVISFIVSIFLNYFMSVKFVYQYGNVGRNKNGFLKFLAFSAIALTITTMGSLLGSKIIGLDGYKIWAIKGVINFIVSIFNFFTRKYYVFNIALIRDDENTINL